jgi:hypothetical protein
VILNSGYLGQDVIGYWFCCVVEIHDHFTVHISFSRYWDLLVSFAVVADGLLLYFCVSGVHCHHACQYQSCSCFLLLQ